jgi:hypothetical protein
LLRSTFAISIIQINRTAPQINTKTEKISQPKPESVVLTMLAITAFAQPTKNASVKNTVNENGETVISFPEARGYYEAENYKITVKDSNNKKVFEKTVISEYVRATDDDVKVILGKLEKGDYKVKVSSYTPYAKKGQVLENTITVK